MPSPGPADEPAEAALAATAATGDRPPARFEPLATEPPTAQTVPSALRPAGTAPPQATADRPSEVQVGEVVGRHVVLGELGRGGMGRVFLARDRELDRMVAIKFILVSEPTRIERFLAEARVTARCTHPNIVAVHEIGQHRGAPYLVLEHVTGQTLAELARPARLPLPRVLTIMTAVARALACAHSHGIVHRDLKPSNVVVPSDDAAKVLDFGIAAYAFGGSDRGPGLDAPTPAGHRGEIAGTLRYMAPEQLAGEALDGRADLWSFGVMLFELLAGTRPYEHLDDTAMREELAALDRPAPSVAELRADLPPGLARVVARCLEKSRTGRFRSADELVAALQRLTITPTACELSLWLTLTPTADQIDRVVLGLARAAADRGPHGRLHPDTIRVSPDGRVELPPPTDPASPRDDLRALAAIADQTLADASVTRTPAERRRAQRMRRALGPALRDAPPRRLTAPRLARRLAAAHTPRRPRLALALLVVTAAVGLTARLTVLRPAAQATAITAVPAAAQGLDRLEREMTRLRANGDAAGADALFERFVAQPGSPAMRTEAWLRRSARERARPDLEAALDSAAAAYQLAPDSRLAVRALTAIAAVQLARRAWNELTATLAAIGPSSDPAITDAAARLALATRRPDEATGLVAARVVAPLLIGQPETWLARDAAAIDLDGDGLDEAIVLEGDTLQARRPGLAPLWTHPSPRKNRTLCGGRDHRGAWVATGDGPSGALFAIDTTGARVIASLGQNAGCAFADLDGDGALELYVGDPRNLVRYRADASGTWHPTIVPIGSVVNVIAAGDFDGDGDSELMVAAGEWQAYDVRVIAGSALTMVDRLRLGRVSAIATVRGGRGQPPVVLARKDSAWPSAVFLPPDRPTGAPDGFYALRFDGARLHLVSWLPSDVRGMVGDIDPIDLDRDGRDEALVTERSTYRGIHRLSLLRLDDDLGLTATTIEGVGVLTTGRFGPDARPTALAAVEDGSPPRSWWLGLGTTPLPPVAVPTTPPTPTPADLDPPLALAWQRAVTLGRVGASSRAVAAFQALSALLPPGQQAAALAEILALRRQRREPVWPVHVAIAERAAPGSPAHLATLRAAAAAALDDGELTEGVRLLDEALRSPALTARDRLALDEQRAALASSTVSLFDGGPLTDAWRVLDPIGVWRDPVTRSLVLDGFGVRPLAAVDLVRGSGPIQFVMEGTLTRAEWGAGLAFELRPLGDGPPLWRATFLSAGGGNVYRLVATLDDVGTVIELGPRPSVDAPAKLRMRVTWSPDTNRMLWEIAIDGVTKRLIHNRRPAATTGWRFGIESHAMFAEGDATRAVMKLTRLDLAGLAPTRSPTASPLDAAALALGNGDYPLARTHLARATGRDAALLAAVVALREHDRAAALTALRRWLGSGPVAGPTLRTLAHLVRAADGLATDVALATAGPTRIAVVALAWTAVARQHPDAELVQRELTQNLRHLDLSGSAPGSAALLLQRARAHARIGELVDARRDLDVLLAPGRRGALPPAVQAEALLARAGVIARQGDRGGARADLLAALAASPWPETTADTVLLDPVLATFAHEPELASVRALGRTVIEP